jgi:UDP-N-acetylmuramate--alanine ligase
VPGRHNIENALGALAAARAAGVSTEEAAPALTTFKGAKRRFEWRGLTEASAAVFDDYAHHPTEVAATLEAARTLGARRLVACFQPHLYSRTRQFEREFGRALALADVVVVMGIYEARERQDDYPGVSGYDIARRTAEANRGRPVYWLPTHEQAIDLLRRTLTQGDVLLTLGAGDVDRVAEALVSDPDAEPPF